MLSPPVSLVCSCCRIKPTAIERRIGRSPAAVFLHLNKE
ncbi:hypothetical protein HMPREF9413_1482 [Paenibacillus sp. HGF7]|nr:hypothetical protein HMPREF9413_1482 [Paenibacillus sp. HGF7]